jgi:EpsI family protein
MTSTDRVEAAGLGWRQAIAFMAFVVVAVAIAFGLTPRQRMSDHSQDISLETEIPTSFKGWHIDQAQKARVVNPQQTEMLNAIYSQNLMRVYVNESGERIMLSIAYGASQQRGFELHRPEVCYVAQGHMIERKGSSMLATTGLIHPVPLERLIATSTHAKEPISYWMRVGDEVMASGVSQPLTRLKYGLLRGLIPDGVLFRVSSYSDESQTAYALQEKFVQDLFASTSPRLQRFLIGPVSGDNTVTRP